MTQEKRRAGRPKKAETAVQQPKVVAPKQKPVIRRQETVSEAKEYEIVKGGGIAFLLPQKGVTIYDKSNDSVREIRYCPNEQSIYRDEQSENAVKQSVTFRDGRIFIPKEKPNLRAFLESHPSNVANGGTIFREVNKKADAEKELQKEFDINEAVMMVREKSIQELLPVAMYFNININAPVSEIRFALLRIAKSKPKEFIQSFDSPQVMARSVIKQAADYQIINLKKDGGYWFDSNALIVSVPVGQDPLDVMCRFCLTEKGSSVFSALEERLEKLA